MKKIDLRIVEDNQEFVATAQDHIFCGSGKHIEIAIGNFVVSNRESLGVTFTVEYKNGNKTASTEYGNSRKVKTPTEKFVKTYYSLIQYCPNACRAEALNVGAILYCPELNYLDCKVIDDYSRIQKVFGPVSNQNLSISIDGTVHRLKNDDFSKMEDFQKFIDTRANSIIITNPRHCRKEDDLEKQLQRLFEELVK